MEEFNKDDLTPFHFVGQEEVGEQLDDIKEMLGKKDWAETLDFIINFYREQYEDKIERLGCQQGRPGYRKIDWTKQYKIGLMPENYNWIKRLHGVDLFFSMAAVVRRMIKCFLFAYRLFGLQGIRVFFEAMRGTGLKKQMKKENQRKMSSGLRLLEQFSLLRIFDDQYRLILSEFLGYIYPKTLILTL